MIRLLSTVEKDFGGPTRLSKDFIDLDAYLRSPKVFTVLTTPLTGALGRRITNHNIFGKRKILNFFLLFFILIFFCKWTISVHKFEGCFQRGQEGSNRFIIFNGCIVEPWIFSVHLKKILENLLFSEKHCGEIFLVIKYEGRLLKVLL